MNNHYVATLAFSSFALKKRGHYQLSNFSLGTYCEGEEMTLLYRNGVYIVHIHAGEEDHWQVTPF